MTIRALAAALTLAALTPLAAHADAPSGDFLQTHAIQENQARTTAQFPRSEHRNYVEFTIDELLADARLVTVTVEQVRRELAAMPQPVVGA